MHRLYRTNHVDQAIRASIFGAVVSGLILYAVFSLF